MAFKIIWSEPALRDLRDLTGFIAEDNPVAAEKTGRAILAITRNLIDHPLMGRVLPELGRLNVRELIRSPYRIIYRVNKHKATAEIIRVWHGARGRPELDI
jgi:addiction module RelE/StbE family toxin